MGRYQFELATRADDAELRSILAATPMEGTVSLSFRREPSFFDAAVVSGDFHQVVICRDTRASRIAGFGCRSVREMYVNGQPTPIGYLSALRLLPEYRNRGLIARGYAFFRRLHADGRAPLYLTTIAEGNERALSHADDGPSRDCRRTVRSVRTTPSSFRLLVADVCDLERLKAFAKLPVMVVRSASH